MVKNTTSVGRDAGAWDPTTGGARRSTMPADERRREQERAARRSLLATGTLGVFSCIRSRSPLRLPKENAIGAARQELSDNASFEYVVVWPSASGFARGCLPQDSGG